MTSVREAKMPRTQPEPKVSVILCTANRADSLRQTIQALGRVAVPRDLSVELVVVNNASSDATPDVIASACLQNMVVRGVIEEQRGVSRARNRGIVESSASVLVFVDDDVRPEPEWLTGMVDPLFSGRADAVEGAVVLAPHLQRPWMTSRHRAWLADTSGKDFSNPTDLIGANMSLSRHVFARIPMFDPELGPPSPYGFGEESLLALMLRDAGYRIAGAERARVVHHFGEERLLRASWLESACRRGRKGAYLAHHWYHRKYDWPSVRGAWASARLGYWRFRRPAELRAEEGCAEWEMLLVREVSFWRQYVCERPRPAKYRRLRPSDGKAAEA